MAVTDNLGLRKPASDDKMVESLDDFNANADLLDQIIGKLSELDTEAKTSLVAAINEVLAAVGNKADKPTTATVSLPASGWDTETKTQTVTVTGVTETANCIVTAAPASFGPYYGAAWVRCTAQGAGTLTFACETVPTEDLTANVLILG